ncbi:MAG: glucose-6-phosphate isomerase [Acidimicrobiales bacterium]
MPPGSGAAGRPGGGAPADADPEVIARRLVARDLTLWPQGSVAANRLGWLSVADDMARQSDDLASWASTIDQSRVVLLGMGGSSLGPAVLGKAASVFALEDARELVVLDTTDPATISETDLADAAFLVSSKSGTTLEVEALLAHAWEQVPDGRRYVAITDPGTPLQRLAEERGFRRIFANRPDIGGRYSVLSYFGMVPAALAGYAVEEICEGAASADMARAASQGLSFGRAALSGRDKLTIRVPEAHRAFGLWVEQLVAESTGKSGRGCIPVPTTEAEHGSDRHHLELALSDVASYGRSFYELEAAVAVAGHALSIDPFDEPNVAESKRNTATALASLPLPPVPEAAPADLPGWLEETVKEHDYLSVQAYVAFGQDERLEAARRRLRDHLGGIAVTAGYGPRFLHSTGQLHKGGPNELVAIQVVPASARPALPVPGHPYDFATLISAQAYGDYQSLRSHDRRVIRVATDDLAELLP